MTAVEHRTPLASNWLSDLRGGEMVKRMQAKDWSQTPLGEVETWPQSLRTSLSICLTSRFPMVIWWGPELVLLYNDGWRPILGPNKDARALGAPGREIWSEIWDVIGPMFENVKKTGEATWSDDGLLLANRYGYIEDAYFTWSYSPIRDETGGVGGIFTAVTETTERVVGERRLRTLRDLAARNLDSKTVEDVCRRAAEVLASNPQDVPFAMIYLIDAKEKIARLSGSAGISVQHPACPDRIRLEDPIAPWPFGEVFSSAKPAFIHELHRRFPDLPTGAWPDPPDSGVVLPILLPGHSVPDAILVIGVNPRRALDDSHRYFHDRIAAQLSATLADAYAYEEERKRADALVELDRAKTAFFSNVSHEFRTPLTLMLGPIEELLNKPETEIRPENRHLADLAHRNGLRLLKLVNTLLDFSRVESGRIEARFQPTDLARYTADLASIFRSAVEKAGLQLIVDCPSLSEPVYVDREMWEKIVFNLISNALKFTFKGEIAVSLREEAGRVVLRVRDTGVGIPAAELPKIFQRFFRAHGVRSRTHEGTGIGLALVQELARLHGGGAHVESEEGKGSLLTVEVQAGRHHLPPDRVKEDSSIEELLPVSEQKIAPWLMQALPQEPETGEPPETSYVERHAQSKARILLADDNADMRSYVKRLLSEHYAVDTVNDGIAALDALSKQKPDLVLTDVMMPGMNGFELLGRLRSDESTRAIPIILLSARAGEEARVEGLDAGADDYLTKPFSARELLARVDSQLAMVRLRREGEVRLTQVLESITDGFQTLDAEWRFTFMNAAARKILGSQGLNPDELIGKVFWDVFPETHGTIVEKECRRAVRENVSVQFENFYEPWQRWFSVRAYPVLKGGLTIYFEDVTSRKKTEAALRESEQRAREINTELERRVAELQQARRAALNLLEDAEITRAAVAASEKRYRSLVSVVTDVPWTVDPEGRFATPQGAWEKFTGQPWTEHKNFGWLNAIHPDDRNHVESLWRKAKQENSVYNSSGRLWHAPSQQWRYFTARATPIRDESGQVREWVGSCTDVDDQKRAEERLERMVAERTARLKETISDLEAFSYSVSHDLRSPLRAMQGYAEELVTAATQLSPEHQDYLNRIRRAAARLDRLTQEVLTYSKISRGEISLHTVSLTKLVHDVVEQYPNLQNARGGILIQDPLLDVVGNDAFVTQVVSNLLNNAVKFMEPEKQPRIVIRTEMRGKFVRLWVEDNGIGIDRQHSDRIFQIFGRVHPDKKYEGTGIGLAIVKKSVERMHGQVGFESELKKGSSFWVELPAADSRT